MDKILIFYRILSYSCRRARLKERSASDYNAVYNYITKKSTCQGGFINFFKYFDINCIFLLKRAPNHLKSIFLYAIMILSPYFYHKGRKFYIKEVNMVPNSILKKNARDQLGNNIFSKTWLTVLAAYLIFSGIIGAANNMSCGIAGLIFSGPFLFGFYRLTTNVVRGKKDENIGELFCAFKGHFSRAMLVHLMTYLFTILWTLLFIIPGIVKYYSYSMAQYILQDDPTKSWKQCIDESRKMMDGHKGQLFCLDLSFIGWMLLGFLCCCIGVVFVYPYHEVARANFYMALKAMNEPAPTEAPSPEGAPSSDAASAPEAETVPEATPAIEATPVADPQQPVSEQEPMQDDNNPTESI